MSTTLYFQSVWERTLTRSEKEILTTFFHTLPIVKNKLIVTPFRIKQKKNGGIVTTVFIQNGYHDPYTMDNNKVQIINDTGDVIAVNTYNIQLTIPAKSTMPWSFIFPKEKVLKNEEINPNWLVFMTENEEKRNNKSTLD